MSADTFMIRQMATRKTESLREFHLKNFQRTGLVLHVELARSFSMKTGRDYDSY